MTDCEKGALAKLALFALGAFAILRLTYTDGWRFDSILGCAANATLIVGVLAQIALEMLVRFAPDSWLPDDVLAELPIWQTGVVLLSMIAASVSLLIAQ
ncbi:hypothetical protein BDE18_4294 [Paracoccus pantotrophus]|uniref:Uncharacterized protein n=1 Tax=Paracoccus pantotrophus TaxID=82367 RepID=A0AAE6NVU3_PARPN|nr:hypothetical protein [Paracoccus pantotrophus]QFG36137.1 hypothetical protein ESD82_07830 [Paracoccus pantotrophus]RKS42589.1 hypothetical protein BDE18_4294 [Paracoccus pantotrophus]